MTGRSAVAVVLAVSVVLAGCATFSSADRTPTETPAPTGTSTATEPPTEAATPTTTPEATATDEPEGVRVEGSELPVDADLLFERVTGLLDEDVEPGLVVVEDLGTAKESRLSFDPVHEMLGISRISLNESLPAGITEPSGKVTFDPVRGTDEQIERRLVHEFVHVVQFSTGNWALPDDLDAEATTDAQLVLNSINEGAAVYVSDMYAREHMDGARLQSAVMGQEYHETDVPGTRIQLAGYYFGALYVHDRLDDPSEFGELYERPPRTTEQVLHGYAPDEELPVDLPVDVETGGGWIHRAEDVAGEMFTRATLRAELDRTRAVEAAEGWGNDAWLSFASDDKTALGLAWVHRMDTAEDARQLAAALETFADRRAAETDAAFRVERPSEDTVVLLVGDEAFVDATAVSEDGGDVSVTVEGGNASLATPAADGSIRSAGQAVRVA